MRLFESSTSLGPPVLYVFLLLLSVASILAQDSSTTLPPTTPSGGGGPDNPCWAESCQVQILVDDSYSSSTDDDRTSTSPQHSTIVRCRAKVQRLDQLCLHQLPSTTRVLEITNTSVTRIPSSAFASLNLLRKLDLKFNSIRDIEPFAFEGLSNLKRLDLSYNNISSLNASQLEGLPEVLRLKVGHNPLRHVEENIQEALPALRALELGSTLLHCDCRLTWLVLDPGAKKRKRPLRLLGTPSCQSPREFRGVKVKKVSPNLMICRDDPVSVSMLEIEPGLDQVVFAGDSLRLRCKVSGQDTSDKVWWRKGDSHFSREGEHQDITVRTSSSMGKVESYVDIPQLSWGHSGEWACMVEGRGGNSSKAVSVYVIHHGTKYCPTNQTTGNKGRYSWPRTVAQVTVDLPCEALSPPPLGSSWSSMRSRPATKQAHHTCGPNGEWLYLNTSWCPFVSETTRILEHFALTNVTASGAANVVESAHTLRNFTGGHGAAVLRDPVDIFFLAETIRRYSELVASSVNFHSAAQVLVDVIGSTLASSKDLLKAAEFPMESCTNLLKSLWLLTDEVPSMSRTSTPLLNVYQVTVHPETFTEVTCVWYRKNRHSSDRYFRCNTHNYSTIYSIEDTVTDARIRIPGGLFSNVSGANETRLEFFAFDSAKLFPSPLSPIAAWQVTSPVVGVRLKDESALAASFDVIVTLRSAIYSHHIAPGSWHHAPAHLNRWRTDGCQILRFFNSLIMFKCNRLGHFGLLQDMAAMEGPGVVKGAAFKASPPGVYVGSAVCGFFLMASITTWGIHHSRIATTNKNKHSFLNTWVALLFLIALFTVGVHQTEEPPACRTIGILLHYLTTCVLLWLLVSLTNLYKRVHKAIRPPPPQEEPLPDPPPPPKPILRFYLVGWGIALILCGISAAVNLPHYATFSYCFLAWTPSMAAFYAPCAALVLILVAFFLLTQCLLRSSRGGYAEAPGTTETTELELLDTASPASENPPEDELSIASSSLSLADSQHSPTTQLRAHAVTLILFLLTWASAAITTAAPFENVIPFHGVVFSVVYALCASSLGLFIFIYFCLSRTDAMEAWRDWHLGFARHVKEDEAQLTVANNVTSSTFVSPPPSQTPPNNHLLSPPNTSLSSCVAPSMHSVESTHKSSSKGLDSKASNALHALHLNTEGVQYAPEMFYNPKQVGVARRFFQKQRLKQMMKQNNLEVNRADSDCNSSTVYKPRSSNLLQSESDLSGFDSAYLGLSSKINNTNIHVEYTKYPHKALTPEILCVLGPPRDTCSIVSSMENDQHQWPMALPPHNCQSPAYFPPKHLNISRSPINLTEELKYVSQSPVFFSEGVSQALTETPEPKPRRSSRSHKFSRSKRKRSLSRDRDDAPDTQLTSPDMVSHLQDELIPPLNLSHGSSTPPHPVITSEMDWLHLLHHKKRPTQPSHQGPFNYTDESGPYLDDLCGSEDEESVEALNWERELEGRCGPPLSDDGGSSSIGTSLVPEVDPSPPPSLPVSDSPFESPLHRFPHNTPDDSASLDSGSLLSPGGLCPPPPLVSPITPTLTLTVSTPVNTPASPSTPSSRECSPPTFHQSLEGRALLPSATSETLTPLEDDLLPEDEVKEDSSSSSGKETDV